MPGPRPGGEQEQDPRPSSARHAMALMGVEAEERPGARLDGLLARSDLDLAVHDDEPGVLVHLVVTERLPRG